MCQCLHTFLCVEDWRDGNVKGSVRGTKLPLPRGLVKNSRPHDTNPWMPSQEDPEALLSSPATLNKKILCAHPAVLSADPGDRKRPGVSLHERGPCISLGPGLMGASRRLRSRSRTVLDKDPGLLTRSVLVCTPSLSENALTPQ